MGLKKRTIVLACVCLLPLGALIAGCGPAEEAESEVRKELEEPIDTIEVQETEFGLDPSEIDLDEPGTYVFRAVNSGNAEHALAIEGDGVEEQTENIQPGESADLEVHLDPGTYELYCPVGDHAQRGMMGTVTVQEATRRGVY